MRASYDEEAVLGLPLAHGHYVTYRYMLWLRLSLSVGSLSLHNNFPEDPRLRTDLTILPAIQ